MGPAPVDSAMVMVHSGLRVGDVVTDDGKDVEQRPGSVVNITRGAINAGLCRMLTLIKENEPDDVYAGIN